MCISGPRRAGLGSKRLHLVQLCLGCIGSVTTSRAVAPLPGAYRPIAKRPDGMLIDLLGARAGAGLALGVNRSGTVLGGVRNGKGHRSFLWIEAGGLELLPRPTSRNEQVSELRIEGNGNAYLLVFLSPRHAIDRWSPAMRTYEHLAELSEAQVDLRAGNDSGDCVSVSWRTGAARAVYRDGRARRVFKLPLAPTDDSASSSRAISLNDTGAIVGRISLPGQLERVVAWQGESHALHDFGPGRPFAINNGEVVVGGTFSRSTVAPRLWDLPRRLTVALTPSGVYGAIPPIIDGADVMMGNWTNTEQARR